MTHRLRINLQLPLLAIGLLTAVCCPRHATAHDGPDPLCRWEFDADAITAKTLEAKLGPDATLSAEPRVVDESVGQSVRFRRGLTCRVAEDYRNVRRHLPEELMTVSVWAAVDRGEDWGGLVSVMEDDGGTERGWVVGYDREVFTFGLSTQGSDDGDGQMTYLTGKTRWEPGKLYHVVAAYDGTEMMLFVNGKLDARGSEQSGPILYPSAAPMMLGSYRDCNEDYRLSGRIAEIAVYDHAAKPKWVAHEFEHRETLARQEAKLAQLGEGFTVPPYLQFATRESMTVMWRTPTTGTSTVHWGETATCEKTETVDGTRESHEVRLDGLQPETQYFYAVESLCDDGKLVESDVFTFSTAVNRETPFAFAVISDTQGNPTVSKRLAEMAWGHRPNFCLHSGDLVTTGPNDAHWTQHFFPGMKPLIERVPFYPVLGNHEQNAQNYFDYVSLPEPEYHYAFTYGNAEFFMIDSNRKIGPGSEQYTWLERALRNSDATWKFVCHHHPPYSSDENDYGDLWKTNRSTRGDLRARQLTRLYDRHGVDVVWTGHIHSYERTWPLREGKAAGDGTIYMVTGGGGGGLETPGPFRPFFQNHVKRGHHYCLVAIRGTTLELKSYDLEGRLFDTLTVEKRTR